MDQRWSSPPPQKKEEEKRVGPVFSLLFIASFIVFDQRHSRISRAMRVCHVQSLKTRRHLNQSRPRPGTDPDPDKGVVCWWCPPASERAEGLCSTPLHYHIHSHLGGFLRVRKQSFQRDQKQCLHCTLDVDNAELR